MRFEKVAAALVVALAVLMGAVCMVTRIGMLKIAVEALFFS